MPVPPPSVTTPEIEPASSAVATEGIRNASPTATNKNVRRNAEAMDALGAHSRTVRRETELMGTSGIDEEMTHKRRFREGRKRR